MNLIEKYPTLTLFAFLPDRLLDIIRNKTGDNSYRNALLSKLGDLYGNLGENSLKKDILYYKDNSELPDFEGANKVYLLLNLKTSDEKDFIVLLFKPNSRINQQQWELTSVLTEKELMSDSYYDLGTIAGQKLFAFSFWPTFSDSLKQLAKLALPENWSLQEEQDDKDYTIINSYLKHTFAKLYDSGLVFFSKGNHYAVFNTGLVNRNYKYIYALLEKQQDLKSPYRFLYFVIPGIGIEGRLLSENFEKLPMPARYFTDISDVSYVLQPDRNPDEQLPELQLDHYFSDHPERFPLDFLIDGCRKSGELLGLLTKDLSDMDKIEQRKYWEKIGEGILSDSDVYDDLEASLRNAVRKAVMRVSWNYKTAIPVYFPSWKKMSILLPLSFSSDGLADVALVVERNQLSKSYLAPTILDLPTAYSNARLVCKPESDWLNQKTINSRRIRVPLEINEDELI